MDILQSDINISQNNSSQEAPKKISFARRLFSLALIFFIFSFAGWIIETCYFLINYDLLADRGFLLLPFCPIYGTVPVIAFLVLGTPHSRYWKKLTDIKVSNRFFKILLYIAKYLLFAICVATIATIVEFCVGIFFDRVLNAPLWSYEGYNFNIMGYVALSYSALWGILITTVLSTLFPLLFDLFQKINLKLLITIVLVLTLIILTDLVFNLSFTIKNDFHYDYVQQWFPDYYYTH